MRLLQDSLHYSSRKKERVIIFRFLILISSKRLGFSMTYNRMLLALISFSFVCKAKDKIQKNNRN